MYPEPFKFKPERFLLPNGKPNPAVRDPLSAFGFGRRLCPGRHMAHSSLLIAITSILAAFNIEKAVDVEGRVVEPSYEYISGSIWCVFRVTRDCMDRGCMLITSVHFVVGRFRSNAPLPRARRRPQLLCVVVRVY
jgi:hypothetical protein